MGGANTSRSIASTPGIWGRPLIKERRRTTPAEMVGYVYLHSPEWGVQRKWASLSARPVIAEVKMSPQLLLRLVMAAV